MSPDEARARFDASPVAYLATVGADGGPHIVPITFVRHGDTIFTATDGKPKRGTTLRRFDNVTTNPLVSVLVDAYDADWSRLWWARADGRGTVITGGAELDRALWLLRQRYPQYATVALSGPALAIAVDRWSGWSAT